MRGDLLTGIVREQLILGRVSFTGSAGESKIQPYGIKCKKASLRTADAKWRSSSLRRGSPHYQLPRDLLGLSALDGGISSDHPPRLNVTFRKCFHIICLRLLINYSYDLSRFHHDAECLASYWGVGSSLAEYGGGGSGDPPRTMAVGGLCGAFCGGSEVRRITGCIGRCGGVAPRILSVGDPREEFRIAVCIGSGGGLGPTCFLTRLQPEVKPIANTNVTTTAATIIPATFPAE